jgi:AraC-like DNA-binding protein
MLVLGLNGNVLERVRRVMLTPGSADSFEEVACALHMSPRTLRRRLVAHGITFSELRARVCCERAVVLLRSRELSVEAVARELGYSTLSGFVRAFHRWTGKTPAAYRRERLTRAEAPALSLDRPLTAATSFSAH